HPHSFRHTYATDLLLLGVDPSHARKLTGHQSEKAFRRYTLRSEQEAAIAAYYRAIGEEAE
ncbi:MAG: site-specific integrase, partial [Nostoc sp.]